MNKKMIFASMALVFTLPLFAQRDTGSTLDPPYPMTYQYVREADMMWSKRVWRVIDLREKINLPLGYPKTDTHDRMSLIDVIWNAAKEGSITLYANDDFTEVRTIKEAEKLAGAGVDTIDMIEADPPYNSHPVAVKREFATESVIQYRIKEDWYFDKQRSVMEVRIIGIAPIVYATDDKGAIREGGETKPLFWVYFPEARWLLAKFEAFNFQNDSQRRSFDDIFQKRLFNSYVMKESNVYDRRISEYAQGVRALQESDRIKEMIINFEHDMWEY